MTPLALMAPNVRTWPYIHIKEPQMSDLPVTPISHEAIGSITMNPKGFGFVKVGGDQPDVFIPPDQTAGAIHGEQVRISFTLDDTGRALGQVLAVLDSPDCPVFMGRLATVPDTDHRVVHPLDTRWPSRVRLPEGSDLPDGTLVKTRLTTRPCGHIHAEGKIEVEFGPIMTTKVASAIAIAQQHLRVEFSPEALAEATTMPSVPSAADVEGRWDLRKLPLVTIDGDHSRDFDDAVYAERHAEGHRLLVAIADVAHYVPPGSALDAEAALRTTSVYLPDRVLPMFPEAISNGLCSLNPGEDRLCMVAELIVRPDGTIAQTHFVNGVMRSAARLTYTQAAAFLTGEKTNTPYIARPVLTLLGEVYAALAIARDARGALEFDSHEVRFRSDQGTFVIQPEEPRNIAHKLIEECMIAANVAVAHRLLEAAQPAPYRVHTLHSTSRHAEFQAWGAVHGLSLPDFASTRAPDLQALLNQVGDHPLRPALIAQIRRLQGEASYVTLNAGHFGLALDAYTHFTSPIRRYPDLLVHRALKEVIAGQVPSATWGTLDAMALACVAGSRRAVKAERLVVDIQRAGYLSTKVGETFMGTVSGFAPMGAFVTFGPQASSLLGADQLPGLTYDAATRSWKDPEGVERMPMGSQVPVRLVRVDGDRARLYIERATE